MRLRSAVAVCLWALEVLALGQNNDPFAGRVGLSGASATAISDNTSATKEAGEPAHAGLTGGHSLWWTWTAPSTGLVNFSVFGSAGTNAPNEALFSTTALAVYTGSSVGALSEAGSSNNQPQIPDFSTLGAIVTGPSFNLQVTAGTTYQIAFDSTDPTSPVALNINQPPTIVSNITAAAYAGSSFSYTIQASNSPTSYAASGLPTGLSVNPFTGVISGTPSTSGTSSITISATNPAGTGTATFTLTVSAAFSTPSSPAIYGAAATSTIVGDTFSYFINGDSTTTSYALSGLPPGLSYNVSTGEIAGSPTAAGTYPVSISATNAIGTTNATLTIVVAALPPMPVIDSSAVASGTVGSSFEYYIDTASNSVYSVVSQPTSYSASNLPPGLGINTSIGDIEGVPTSAGTFIVPITATNPAGTGSAVVTITIAPQAAPSGMVLITSSALASGTVGSSFNYVIQANGNPTSFTATNLPAGLSLNTQSGYITGTPLTVGTFLVPITASGSGGTANATLTISITGSGASTSAVQAVPLIVSSAEVAGYVGTSLSYPVIGQSASYDYGAPTYGASGLPPGLSINATSGLISGTPTAAGSYQAIVSYTILSEFGSGGSTTGTAIVTFQIFSAAPAPNAAPVITSSVSSSGVVGSSFGYTVTATGNPATYSATGLPGGLSINASSGAITGTPTTAGSYNVSLSATNSSGSGSANIGIVIAATSPAPVITSEGIETDTVGSTFGYYITGSNSPTSYAASNLPPGLSLNTSSGYISGTPSVAGTFTVPISATNASGTGSATLTLVITSTAIPVISSSAATSGAVGSSFSYSISASNSPTSYAASNLPGGLSVITSTGQISGTPTTAGTFTVPISATNAAGTGNANLTISIAPSAAVPVITSAAYATAAVGSSFSYYISASNSPTSYNATNLPSGLSVTSAHISGTPTVTGTFAVPITATNAGGSAQATLTIVIASSPSVLPPVITSAAAASGIANVAFSYATTATNFPTSYSATNLPAGLNFNTTTGVLSGSPSSAGTYSVPISATNSAGTCNAALAITIASAPTVAPVITSSAGADCYSGEPFYYFITASNLPTSFSATNLPSGLTLNSTTGLISGTVSSSGAFSITIGATNSIGTGTATLALSVPYTTASPRITSAATAAPVKGSSFSYKITASTSPFSYSASNLPPGLTLNSSTGTISGTPTTTGTYATTVSAPTSYGTATGVVTFAVGTAATTLPVMTSSDGFNGYVGDNFYCPITASNSPTSFAASGLPAGLTINTSTGIISGTPTSQGTSTATITLTNSAGSSTAKLTLQIASSPPSPHFSSSAAVSGFVASPLSYQLTTNPSSSYYYQASSLPSGLSLNSSTGLISGTPTTAGVFPFFVYTNSYLIPTTTITFVVVSSAPSVPTITSPAAAVGYIGANFTYTFSAANLPTSFGASNLPAGLTFNPTSGTIGGSPQASGVFTIPISATNSIGTSTATLTLNISATPPLPVITSAAMASVTTSTQAIAYSVTAANNPVSYSATGLPPGLSIDSTSGVISGTAGSAGTYNASISASNTGGTAAAVVTFVVSNLSAPVISSNAADTTTVGASYIYGISASNSATSYAASNLPPGLFFDAFYGEIQGTPTRAGQFTIGISATNSAGTGNATLTLTVAAVPPAPTINFYTAVASGTVGLAFSFSFYASEASYTQNLENTYNASGLPPGLSIDQTSGQISGTPTLAGTFATVLSATNPGGTSSSVLTITIAPAQAPVVTSSVGAAGYVGSLLSYSIYAGSGPFQFSATNLPPGLVLNSASGVISGFPTTVGNYTASLSASNSAGTATANVHFLILSAANSPPVITSSAAVGYLSSDPDIFSFGPYETNSFSYTITAANGATSFAATGLPAGLSLNPVTGVIFGVPTASGTFAVPITATNSVGTANAVLTILVATNPVIITASADVAGFVGTPLNYAINSNQSLLDFETDVGAGTIIYIAAGLPPGLTMDTATGTITGTPTAAGTYPVSLSATDAAGASTAVVTFLISGTAPGASAPVISGIEAAASGAVGVPFSYDVWAANLPTNFSASNLPPGLALSILSGTYNGIPSQYAHISGTPASTGTFVVPVTASNAQGSASVQITLVIAAAPATPVIASAMEASGAVGSSFSYDIYLNYDAVTSSAPKTYSASSLPPGLALNTTTGAISGTPTTPGTYAVPLAVTVGGATGNAVLTIVIGTQTTASGVPAISGEAGALGFVGIPFSYSFSAANATGLTASPLPPGVALTLSTGTSNGVPTEYATISGAPTSPGTFSIPVAASNAAGSANATLTVSVIQPQAALPWILQQPANQTAPQGNTVSLNVVASGAPNPTFQWFKNGVVVASGTGATLALNSAQPADSGNYSVAVSNASGTVTSQSVLVTVTTTYGAWQAAHFTPSEIASGQAAETASYNGDGVTNLMKYASGSDPITGAGGTLPNTLIPAGTDHLQIQFQRDSRNTDIDYVVEASSDLTNWTAIASSLNGAPTSNLGGAAAIAETAGIVCTVTVSDAASVSASGTRYLRLKVTGP